MDSSQSVIQNVTLITDNMSASLTSAASQDEEFSVCLPCFTRHQLCKMWNENVDIHPMASYYMTELKVNIWKM